LRVSPELLSLMEDVSPETTTPNKPAGKKKATALIRLGSIAVRDDHLRSDADLDYFETAVQGARETVVGVARVPGSGAEEFRAIGQIITVANDEGGVDFDFHPIARLLQPGEPVEVIGG